jgi:hypothetical protein
MRHRRRGSRISNVLVKFIPFSSPFLEGEASSNFMYQKEKVENLLSSSKNE